MTANLQGGDATIIAGGINFIPNKLITRPEIKRPEDLKGKRIAISRFGSASDYATQLALEKLNVNPKDVSIIQAGGNSTRFSRHRRRQHSRDAIVRTADHHGAARS